MAPPNRREATYWQVVQTRQVDQICEYGYANLIHLEDLDDQVYYFATGLARYGWRRTYSKLWLTTTLWTRSDFWYRLQIPK